jgi:ATP-binding cassette, subfamily B, bacterial
VNDGVQPLSFAGTLLRRQKARLAVAIGWSVLFIVMPMQVPILTGALVNVLHGREARIYGARLPAHSRKEAVRLIAMLLLAVPVARGASAYFRQSSQRKMTRLLIAETRRRLIEKIETMSLDLHQRFGAGDLLNRVLNDAAQLRQFAGRVVIQTVTNVVRVGYPLGMLFWIQPRLAFVACSVLPTQWLITRRLQARLHESVRAARQARTRLTTVLKEQIDGVETLQSLDAVRGAVAQSDREAERVEELERRIAKYRALITATVWSFTSLGLSLTWWLGAELVLRGRMNIGELVVAIGLVAFIYAPFRRFTAVIDVAHRISIGLEHVQQILDLPSSIREDPQAQRLLITRGTIELRRLSFAYDQRQVLADVSLRIEPRSLTAVAGRSGSGKSTLLRLITRMYDPLDGQVLIDGQDVRRVALDSLRSQVVRVPQQPVIFTGTVADNLRLAKPDASQEEIADACRAAQALEFIERLPRGFDTPLGRGGASLSGGEIQRVAIARAVLMNSKILLLDEPTSALDPASQAAILHALQRLKARMTIVMAAHRVEALQCAEHLIALDGGRVIEQGPQRDLLTSPALGSVLYEERCSV